MNENIIIDTIDIELAKNISKYISDPTIRNRAMANAIAAKISKKYFENYDVDIKSGLHNVSEVLEKIDISDIYINGSYIDVRVYFDENECCIPKYNIKNGIAPLAYMFIKLDPELDCATVTGFISSDAVTTCDSNDEFYIVKEDLLTSFYDIEPYIGSDDSFDDSDDIDEAIYDFLDNKLSSDIELIKTLLRSKQYRLKLINASKAKQVFNFVTISDKTEDTNIINNTEKDNINDFDSDFEEELTLSDSVDDDSLVAEDDEFVLPDSVDDTSLVAEDEELALSDFADDNSLTIGEEDYSLEEIADSNITALESDDLMVSEQIEAGEVSEELQETSNAENTLNIIPEENNSITIEEKNDDISPQIYETILDIADETKEISSDEIKDMADSQDVIADITEEIVEQKNDTLDNREEQIEQYATETTPSIDAFEAEDANIYELTEEDLESDSEQTQNKDNKSIETLFENETETNIDNLETSKNTKKSPSALSIIGIAVVVAGLGYFGYNKYMTSTPSTDTLLTEQSSLQETQDKLDSKADYAMPLETVENEKQPETKNEGNSLSIPEIEKNLGASISVSNLTAQWEVPQSYVANSTATRYLTRMGKVIQLELKTELLLLSKPPITNKISVEVEYNKNKQKFEVKNITASSGDTTVDNTIKRTVSKVLDTNMNVNMNVFNNMQGNPVLVIRL